MIFVGLKMHRRPESVVIRHLIRNHVSTWFTCYPDHPLHIFIVTEDGNCSLTRQSPFYLYWMTDCLAIPPTGLSLLRRPPRYRLKLNRSTTRQILFLTSSYVLITAYLVIRNNQTPQTVNDYSVISVCAASSSVSTRFNCTASFICCTHFFGSIPEDPHRSYPGIPVRRHTRMWCECKRFRLHIGIVCPCIRWSNSSQPLNLQQE